MDAHTAGRLLSALGRKGMSVMTATDNWSLKEYRHPSSPERSVIRKNLCPIVPPGSASHPFVCYLTFGFLPRDASGLPTAELADKFVEIEETEFPPLEEGDFSVMVGVVLKSGIK